MRDEIPSHECYVSSATVVEEIPSHLDEDCSVDEPSDDKIFQDDAGAGNIIGKL